ncbi:Transition state regulatory protein AbrB [Bacillus licheniformis]|nr:Transition state regulatory protein AbrB [Bacillus licheniformis]
MKNTGIVRRIDELGRVVLPVEMRRVLNINEKDRSKYIPTAKTSF